MAKNFVQHGTHLTVPVTAAVKSGNLVKVGDIVGVALTDAKSDDGTNHYTTLAVEGVWAVETTTNYTAGQAVKEKPVGASAAVTIGYAVEPTTDGHVYVKLIPSMTVTA